MLNGLNCPRSKSVTGGRPEAVDALLIRKGWPNTVRGGELKAQSVKGRIVRKPHPPPPPAVLKACPPGLSSWRGIYIGECR